MAQRRDNIYFRPVDLADGFAARGDVPGIAIKVLSDDLDSRAKRGSRTRLLRLAPGTETPEAHAHDYWEEIYMLEGEMTVRDGADGEKRVAAPAYAARAPGVMHGPVRSDAGCLMIDFCWYPDPRNT